MSRAGSGSTGSRPWRSRPKAARADGARAVMARACSTRGRPGRAVASAPHRDGGAQRVHGVRVGRQVAQPGEDAVVQRCAGQVRLGGPTVGPEQLGDLGERALAHELSDGIATVEEPAVVAVDEGQARSPPRRRPGGRASTVGRPAVVMAAKSSVRAARRGRDVVAPVGVALARRRVARALRRTPASTSTPAAHGSMARAPSPAASSTARMPSASDGDRVAALPGVERRRQDAVVGGQADDDDTRSRRPRAGGSSSSVAMVSPLTGSRIVKPL